MRSPFNQQMVCASQKAFARSIPYRPSFYATSKNLFCLQKDMFSLNESNRFVLSLTSVNMRNGINGLCGLILYTGLVPTNGDDYIFINRNRTILKLLYWERGGYIVYHKRLEEVRISHKVFLKEGVGFKSLRCDELVLLLVGINPNTPRRKRYNSRETRS